MPIWDSEFEFAMKWAGYLLEVIPGWSVAADAILRTGIGNWVLKQGFGLREDKNRKAVHILRPLMIR
jgi:hypothetical protein